MLDLQYFLNALEKDFFARLQERTEWKRNEILKEFDDAIKNTLVLTYTYITREAKDESS